MHNTAGGPLHYSGERWSSRVQQTETGSDVLTPLWRSRDFYWQHTNAGVDSHHHKLSWRLRLCLQCVRHRFVTGRYLFPLSSFRLCICRVLEAPSNPPPPHPPSEGIPCCVLTSNSSVLPQTLYEEVRGERLIRSMSGRSSCLWLGRLLDCEVVSLFFSYFLRIYPEIPHHRDITRTTRLPLQLTLSRLLLDSSAITFLALMWTGSGANVRDPCWRRPGRRVTCHFALTCDWVSSGAWEVLGRV